MYSSFRFFPISVGEVKNSAVGFFLIFSYKFSENFSKSWRIFKKLIKVLSTPV